MMTDVYNDCTACGSEKLEIKEENEIPDMKTWVFRCTECGHMNNLSVWKDSLSDEMLTEVINKRISDFKAIL